MLGVLRVPSVGLFSAKQETQFISSKFRQNLPCTGRLPKPARKKTARMADIHNFGTMADTATYGTMANTSTKGTKAH